jgi:hypothetical protein
VRREESTRLLISLIYFLSPRLIPAGRPRVILSGTVKTAPESQLYNSEWTLRSISFEATLFRMRRVLLVFSATLEP